LYSSDISASDGERTMTRHYIFITITIIIIVAHITSQFCNGMSVPFHSIPTTAGRPQPAKPARIPPNFHKRKEQPELFYPYEKE